MACGPRLPSVWIPACRMRRPKHRVKTGPTGKGTERCIYLNENLSQGCLRSSLAEVVEDGLANCGHEWQQQVGTCLRLLYPKLVAAPVNVFQLQANHFAGAQSVRNHQEQHGVVA